MEQTTEKQTNEILDLMLLYKPLRDEVVIKLPTPAEREALLKSKSGIIKSTDLKKADNSLLYTIVAIGKDVKEVKVGNKVLFKSNAVLPIIVIKGIEYGQISEMWVCGIITEE